MVGRVTAFLELIQHAAPEAFRSLAPISQLGNRAGEAEALRAAYESMPAGDFSRQVLALSTDRLSVASLGDIGWSDLGDPRRLVTTLFESGIENPWVQSGCCNHCGLALAAAY
jgi:hypothetical protein